jgi:Cys-rich protein (TIGR01571 family)
MQKISPDFPIAELVPNSAVGTNSNYVGTVQPPTAYVYTPPGQQYLAPDPNIAAGTNCQSVQPPLQGHPQPIVVQPTLVVPEGNIAVTQAIPERPGFQGKWRAEFCDCCVDGCSVCCYVCCCPCIPIGFHARIVGWNWCLAASAFTITYSPTWVVALFTGIPALPLSCFIHAPLRRKLRERYGINESFRGEDWVYTFLCPLCAICQEIHETRVHGEGHV